MISMLHIYLPFLLVARVSLGAVQSCEDFNTIILLTCVKDRCVVGNGTVFRLFIHLLDFLVAEKESE